MNSYRIHTHYLVIIIAKKKRELSFVTRSLSLSVFLLLLFVFTFHPQKWALDTKIKTLFPPLSLSFWTKVYAHHRLKCTCYNCVIKGLHEYFIRVEICFFVIIAARCLFFVHTREREREREREKKKEREERAKTTPTKILYLQNTRNVEKKQVVATAFLPRLEREREIGSETRCIITQFSVRNRRLRIMHFC